MTVDTYSSIGIQSFRWNFNKKNLHCLTTKRCLTFPEKWELYWECWSSSDLVILASVNLVISIRIIQENIIQSLGVYIIKSFKVDGVHSALYCRMYTLNTYFFLYVKSFISILVMIICSADTLFILRKKQKKRFKVHILLYCIS